MVAIAPLHPENPFEAMSRIFQEMASTSLEAKALRSERIAEPDRARRRALLVSEEQAAARWDLLFLQFSAAAQLALET